METDILPEKNTKNTKGIKKGDFWGGLECMSSGAGLMADWEWALRSALPILSPFLKPTEEHRFHFRVRRGQRASAGMRFMKPISGWCNLYVRAWSV
jgi:hypothetical protein